MANEYNEYYYQAFKTLHDNYKAGYERDPFNDFLYGDIEGIIDEHKVNITKYQKSKDYKKLCEELQATWQKQGDCYYGYDDSASKDYRWAAMSVEENIHEITLPNGEALDDPDGTIRKKWEKEREEMKQTPSCNYGINYYALRNDLEDFGIDYMEDYLKKKYPSGEWRALFDALVNGDEITDELVDFTMDENGVR